MKNRPTKPESTRAILSAGRSSEHLLRMLNQQQQLLEFVRSILPPPVDSHCLHARISGDQLILHTDSSAWMTRLRFHGPQLLKALHAKAPQLKTVKTRVLMDISERRSKAHGKKIPAKVAASIRKIALSVSDPELGAALMRLGRTGKRDQEETVTGEM